MQKQCFPNDGKKLELDFGRPPPLPRLGPLPSLTLGRTSRRRRWERRRRGTPVLLSLGGTVGRSVVGLGDGAALAGINWDRFSDCHGGKNRITQSRRERKGKLREIERKQRRWFGCTDEQRRWGRGSLAAQVISGCPCIAVLEADCMKRDGPHVLWEGPLPSAGDRGLRC